MEQKNNLYIKTAQITKENMVEIPEKDFLPIFLDSDLRANHLVSCYHKTAIHFYDLSPSRYLTSKVRAGMSLEEFESEYYTELLSKNWSKILKRFSFLMELSGAVGIAIMTGIETPSYIHILTKFIKSLGISIEEY